MLMIKFVVWACGILIRQVAGIHSDAAALRKGNNIWHAALRIARQELFGAYSKGNLVKIVHRFPYSAISFYSYERYKEFSTKFQYVNLQGLLGGGLAWVTAASVTYPLDVLRTHLTTQKTTRYYKGIFHSCLQFVEKRVVVDCIEAFGPPYW